MQYRRSGEAIASDGKIQKEDSSSDLWCDILRVFTVANTSEEMKENLF